MSIESVMLSNHLILWCPLHLSPSVFPGIRVFSNGSALCSRWPKHWSFSFASVLPVNIQVCCPLGLTGLISLQSKELSSLFQPHKSKASVLQHSVFFMAVHNFSMLYPICSHYKILAVFPMFDFCDANGGELGSVSSEW